MQKKLVVGLVAPAALGIWFLACSSSTPANPYPDVQSFCAAVATSICQENSTCGVSASSCTTYREAQCAAGTIVVPFPGSTSTLSRTYTSGNVSACLSALNGAFNGANKVTYAQLFGQGAIIDTCEAVFAGKSGHGAACQTNYDCTSSGDICAPIPGQASGGLCETPTQKSNVGDPCADPGDVCPANSYCKPASGTSECAAVLAIGAACTSDAECGTANHCASGLCAARGGPGAACTDDSDCNDTTSSQAAPLCDLAAQGGECEVGLQFAPGAYDCTGYLLGGSTGSSSGGSSGGSSGSSSGSSSGGSSGSSSGSSSGGSSGSSSGGIGDSGGAG